MEYYKYICGHESSFHPSFLSFHQQRPITLSTLARQPLTTAGQVMYTPRQPQYFDKEEQGEDGSDMVVTEAEGSELFATSSSRDQNIGNHEEKDEKSDKELAEHATSDDDNEREHLLVPEFQTQRKKQQSRGFKLRRSRKVAPLPYTPASGVAPAPGSLAGTQMGLAWMDTVNGAQLMSIHFSPQPPSFPISHQTHLPPTSPYHPPPPHHPPDTHSFSSRQPHSRRTDQQQVKRIQRGRQILQESGTDFVDGENKNCEIIEHSQENYEFPVSDGASDHENTPKNNTVPLDAVNDGYGKIHETDVPTNVVDGVTDCEQVQENEPLPANTISDTSDPNHKRAQEDKLRDRDTEEPHIVPMDHSKEVSHNTGPTAPAGKHPDTNKSVTTSSLERNVQEDTAPTDPTGYSIQELIQQVSYTIHAVTISALQSACSHS